MILFHICIYTPTSYCSILYHIISYHIMLCVYMYIHIYIYIYVLSRLRASPSLRKRYYTNQHDCIVRVILLVIVVVRIINTRMYVFIYIYIYIRKVG